MTEETNAKLIEMFETLVKKQEEYERNIAFVKSDVDKKIRVLEASEIKELDDLFHELEVRVKVLEEDKNNRRHNLGIVINFIVQLVWVCMAAYILSRLGLQLP